MSIGTAALGADVASSADGSPAWATRPRVAHVMRSYGEVSETFIADGVLAVDRAGWESWVVATRVARRGYYPFPPEERVLEGTRAPARRRLQDRVLLRSSADRRSAGLEPAVALARPDVIHAHFGWGAADARLTARRLDVPLVATFRGADLTIFPGWKRLYRDYRRMFGQLSHAVCISTFLAEKLRGYGYAGPISIVPSGIRLDEFPRREHVPEGEDVRLLYVGRLVPYKGVDVLLRAVARASGGVRGLSLDVVGDGPVREDLERLATELGIAHRVRFHGAQPRPGVRAAMERAHVFVMPSRTTESGQAEGLGNVQKEAMAVGVPVIATDNGGIPETIAPEHRGDLVPGGDSDALADAIVALVEERERWPERVALARDWVEREFDWNRLGARLTGIYEGARSGEGRR